MEESSNCEVYQTLMVYQCKELVESKVNPHLPWKKADSIISGLGKPATHSTWGKACN
jgi:hypothetical protein